MSVERSSIPNDSSRVTEETTTAPQALQASRSLLSADTWAVLLGLAVAALVKLHILNTVTW